MKIILSGIFFILFFVFNNITYAQTTYIVQASDYTFSPSSLTINQGDTVKWVWVNGMHTTTSDSTVGVEVWNGPLNQSQQAYSVVFSHVGVFHYHCVYHVSLGMKGTITVESPTSVFNQYEKPYNYLLEQNYPNPFNPTTEIKYSIAKSSFVTLVVYNFLGEKVKTLISQKQKAGKYSLVFDFSYLPSGIYFYHIKAGNFTSTKKMVLLK